MAAVIAARRMGEGDGGVGGQDERETWEKKSGKKKEKIKNADLTASCDLGEGDEPSHFYGVRGGFGSPPNLGGFWHGSTPQ